MAANDLVLGVTGASGSEYAIRLLEVWLRAGRKVHLTISPSAAQVFVQEVGRPLNLNCLDPAQFLGEAADDLDMSLVHFHDHTDFSAGIASGSFLTAGMAICPCSMGTVSAVAHGTSGNLIHRAADVHLKERRKLVLVPRETPLGVIQLRNLTAAAEAGAVILPAMPAFYTRPRTVAEMIDFVVGRVCDQLGVEHRLFARWGS